MLQVYGVGFAEVLEITFPYPAGIKRRQATTPRLTPAYNPLKFLLQPFFNRLAVTQL